MPKIAVAHRSGERDGLVDRVDPNRKIGSVALARSVRGIAGAKEHGAVESQAAGGAVGGAGRGRAKKVHVAVDGVHRVGQTVRYGVGHDPARGRGRRGHLPEIHVAGAQGVVGGDLHEAVVQQEITRHPGVVGRQFHGARAQLFQARVGGAGNRHVDVQGRVGAGQLGRVDRPLAIGSHRVGVVGNQHRRGRAQTDLAAAAVVDALEEHRRRGPAGPPLRPALEPCDRRVAAVVHVHFAVQGKRAAAHVDRRAVLRPLEQVEPGNRGAGPVQQLDLAAGVDIGRPQVLARVVGDRQVVVLLDRDDGRVAAGRTDLALPAGARDVHDVADVEVALEGGTGAPVLGSTEVLFRTSVPSQTRMSPSIWFTLVPFNSTEPPPPKFRASERLPVVSTFSPAIRPFMTSSVPVSAEIME